MTAPLRGFFRFSLVYFLAMLVLVWAFRDEPVQLLKNTLATPLFNLSLLLGFLPWLLGLLTLALYLNRNRPRLDLMRALAYALAGNAVFAYTFSAVKTSLPSILPYYADPFFARLDKGLHFGVDPWVLTHKLSGIIPPDLPQLVYYDLWFLPAFFFPMFLVLLDTNPTRVARFLVIYVFVWVGLGNVVALIGMSGGPVYFGRLTGLQDFAGLTDTLQSTGLADASIGRLQDLMWRYLDETNQLLGAGISAFPSVHVGVAAVIAVYAFERHWAAGVLFGAYVLIVLFLSVYLGWHYAIDGYFSIAVVLGLWRLRLGPRIAV
jgi:PAP2 superfamily protein